MLSRRDFLRGGAAAGVLSATTVGALGVTAASEGALAFEAVCDTRWHEANEFLGALGGQAYRAHGVTTDPGAVLGLVGPAIAAGRPIVGFTTDPVLLLAEHVAGREGYALVFHSDHRHDGTALTHVLRGETALLAALEPALLASGAAWPALLARHANALAASRALAATRRVEGGGARPAGSPGHLTTWVLAPAHA
jgi:hypothetical protein